MMTKQNGPAPWWFGGLFLAAGGFIMLIGMEVIPVDPASIHAPMWVITMAGGVFFLGGVMALTNGLVPESASTVLAAVFIAMMAAMFSWVAFGPGEREFTTSVSVGPVSTSSRGSGGMGRIMFGFGSILMWVMLMGLVYKAAKGWIAAGGDDERDDDGTGDATRSASQGGWSPGRSRKRGFKPRKPGFKPRKGGYRPDDPA